MRKVLSKIGLLLVVLVMLVSCEEESTNVEKLSEDKVAVKFVPSINPAKSLTVSDDPVFTWLEYKAAPGYDVSGAVISGETKAWKKITTKNADSSFTTDQVFTQGYWTFEIQVGDSETVYYTGTATAYLTAGSDPVVVNVDLVPKFDSLGEGTLKINLSTPALSTSAGSFAIKIYDSEKKNLITTAKVGQTTIDFSSYSVNATLSESKDTASIEHSITLVPGIYILEIKYVSGTSSTQEAIVAFKVVAGCESSLQGTLENGAYVASKIVLKRFDGTLEEDKANHKYTFKPEDANYPGTVTYMWFINGNKTAETSSVFTFTEQGNAAYCLSCIAINTNGTNKDVVSNSIIVEGLPKTE